jgi:hypothetical protein
MPGTRQPATCRAVPAVADVVPIPRPPRTPDLKAMALVRQRLLEPELRMRGRFLRSWANIAAQGWRDGGMGAVLATWE